MPLLLAVVIAGLQIRALSGPERARSSEGVESGAPHAAAVSADRVAWSAAPSSTRCSNDPRLLEVYRDTASASLVTLNNIETAAADSVRRKHSQALRQSLAARSTARCSRAHRCHRSCARCVDSDSHRCGTQRSSCRASTGERRSRPAFASCRPRRRDAAVSVLAVRAADPADRARWSLVFTLVLMRPIRARSTAPSASSAGARSRRRSTCPARATWSDLGRQLEWLRMRLLDLAQERNRFLRHMSHELKTPLANIREGTELLMDGAVGAAGQRPARGGGDPARQRHQAAAADRKPAVVQRLAGARRPRDQPSSACGRCQTGARNPATHAGLATRPARCEGRGPGVARGPRQS